MPLSAFAFRRPLLSQPRPLPIPRLPRLLADMQTTITRGGLTIFAGDVERFIIFSLIARASLSRPERNGAISIHSVALSLSRPFETVRRHVSALIAAGLCHRTREGVQVCAATWDRADITRQFTLAHDSFVRFVEDALYSRVIQAPRRRPDRKFQCLDGISAATDMMLAIYDSHRHIEKHRVDVALFFAVLHLNALRYEADPDAVTLVDGTCAPFTAAHAVRLGTVARLFAMPETTVRRRLQPLVGAGLPLTRTASGVLVSSSWLHTDEPLAAARASHEAIRLILTRVAAAGFPFAEPWTAYVRGRPPSAGSG